MVNWDGWPAIYNQWILASEIENLETNTTQNLNDDETQNQTTFDETEITTENEGVSNGESKNLDTNTSEKNTKKVYVGFINDDNIPSINENIRIKRNNRKVINKHDENIPSFMEKKIIQRKNNISNSLSNKRILKVNVIDDEQIKFIKKLKGK